MPFVENVLCWEATFGKDYNAESLGWVKAPLWANFGGIEKK